MGHFSKRRILFIVALLVTVAVVFGAVLWALMAPSGGGVGSAMFYSNGIVTGISTNCHHVDILICRSDIYDSNSTVTFDFSNHTEELCDLSLGEKVTVHHWIDSRDGKTVVARSVELETGGGLNCK